MTTYHCVISIGSNLGDRTEALQGAVDHLAQVPGVRVTAVSDVVETDPVGGPDQPPYLNAIVIAESTLTPQALLEQTNAIEEAFGRVRDVRWGPRTLDIDLVDLGIAIDTDELTLPHPRAHERGFVVVPWRQVEPGARLTGHGPIADLAAPADGVHPTDVRLVIT